MRSAAVLALASLHWPASLHAADTPTAMLDFVEDHCARPIPGAAMLELPEGWKPVNARRAAAQAQNIAIEEGISYADFAIYQSGALLVDPNDKWFVRSVSEYTQELRSQRDFIQRGWTRLFLHRATGTHLLISAGIFEGDDVEVWDTVECWLWHPDANNPLGAAIIDRWDLPIGTRLPNPFGQYSHHYATLFVDGKKLELQTMVIRPDTTFTKHVAPTILRLRVQDR